MTACELDLGAGALPATPGEGLRHIPHGSDWPSIREAGMNADTLGASPGNAASPDGYGYAQQGNETVVRLNQRKRLVRWSQKAPDLGPAIHEASGIHPTQVPAEFSTLRPSPNPGQERSNLVRALWTLDRRRCQPHGARGGIPQEANACGKAVGYADVGAVMFTRSEHECFICHGHVLRHDVWLTRKGKARGFRSQARTSLWASAGAFDTGSITEERNAKELASSVLKQRRGERSPRRL